MAKDRDILAEAREAFERAAAAESSNRAEGTKILQALQAENAAQNSTVGATPGGM